MTFKKVQSLAELSETTAASEASEWALRVKLAGTYRLFAHLGWDYLIFGHITVRVPGPEHHFLINPFGLRFDEVTASNLVKIDADANIIGSSKYPVNPAGFFIHSAIHQGRMDAQCVMHTHTTAGMALAATETEVLPVDFAGSAAYGRVAYHDFAGVHADESDSDALVASLSDKNYLVLKNHGLLTCGTTIAKAFQRMYWLETACKVQTTALAMNVPIRKVEKSIATHHAQVLDGDNGELTLAAMIRLMEQKDPSFME